MDQPVAFSTNLVTASAANTMVRWASMGFQDAHAFCGRFFRWYNDEHRHSGIGLHTPADVHYGRAELVRARRGEVLSAAYTQHPERFVRKPPRRRCRRRCGSISRRRPPPRRSVPLRVCLRKVDTRCNAVMLSVLADERARADLQKGNR